MTSIASADIYKVAEALRTSGKLSGATTQDVLVQSANYMKGDMESRVPVRTGRLKQSIQIRVEGDRVTIGPDTEYAWFVETGTQPHTITAKNKKALAFRVGGRMIIRKEVHHPGTKAQPYVMPAFQDWIAELGEAAAAANVKTIQEAS